jgi:hypothetical protein
MYEVHNPNMHVHKLHLSNALEPLTMIVPIKKLLNLKPWNATQSHLWLHQFQFFLKNQSTTSLQTFFFLFWPLMLMFFLCYSCFPKPSPLVV